MGQVRFALGFVALGLAYSQPAAAQSRAAQSKAARAKAAQAAAAAAAANDAQAAAAAATANNVQAADLKQQADADFDAKKYQEALALYDQSYALVPQTAIFYNRGRVYQYLGQYPRAQQELERFAAEATPDIRAKVPGFSAILADVQKHVATVHIVCAVPSAHVLVGSMDMGVTPLPDIHVNAGQQRVDVLADGYYPFHETIDLPGGQSTSIQVNLSSRDRHGLLVIKSGLVGTEVAIDGKNIGLAPSETALDQGTHDIKVMHDGYSDASSRIVLRAGERKEIELSPLTRPSVFSRWWFWTITGAVVVSGAAVVTTVALTTEKSPSGGDFSPGALHF